MTIWILAVLLIVAGALAGWRQGAIRAGIIFVAIFIAALLAVPVGHLLRPLLRHFGVTSPITAWAVTPIVGFIVASIPFIIVAIKVHNRIEYHYKYKAGDLQLALWSRLNSRLGICIGVMNGAAYFVLASFYFYNMAYWSIAVSGEPSKQSVTTRLVNSLGEGLESSGFARTASAVGTVSPVYYELADLAGLLMQNPRIGGRLASYPGLVSLWHRGDLQPLVTDPLLTNAPAAGSSINEILGDPQVQSFLANKDQIKEVLDPVTANLDDLTTYLKTGVSAKYGNEPILGSWQFDAPVTLAWFRQDQPKINPNEMAAIRAVWSQAYGPTTLLFTGDGKLFVKNWPKFLAKPEPNQPPYQAVDADGDWSKDGTNYTLHVTLDGDEKYLNATTDGTRMRIKDGRNLLIFDFDVN